MLSISRSCPYEPAAILYATKNRGDEQKPNKLFIFNLKDHVYLLELFSPRKWCARRLLLLLFFILNLSAFSRILAVFLSQFL